MKCVLCNSRKTETYDFAMTLTGYATVDCEHSKSNCKVHVNMQDAKNKIKLVWCKSCKHLTLVNLDEVKQ